MTARTPIASTVPEPHGKPGGPGAFHIKGAMYPPYIEHVAGDLMKDHPESQAYEMAIGIVRNWAHGHDGHGHKVSAQVQAAAAKAIAEYDALRARAKAIPNKGGRRDMSRANGGEVDLASRNGHHIPGTPYEWKHGYIPLTHTAALQKTKGSKKAAEKLVPSGEVSAHEMRRMQGVINRGNVAARERINPSSADITAAAAQWKRDNPGKVVAGHEREIAQLSHRIAAQKFVRTGVRSQNTPEEAAAERQRAKDTAARDKTFRSETFRRLATEKTAAPHAAPHTVTPGTHATIKGIDEHGNELTLTGKVTGNTESARFKRGRTTGGEPMRTIAIQRQGSSGLIRTDHVYVPDPSRGPQTRKSNAQALKEARQATPNRADPAESTARKLMFSTDTAKQPGESRQEYERRLSSASRKHFNASQKANRKDSTGPVATLDLNRRKGVYEHHVNQRQQVENALSESKSEGAIEAIPESTRADIERRANDLRTGLTRTVQRGWGKEKVAPSNDQVLAVYRDSASRPSPAMVEHMRRHLAANPAPTPDASNSEADALHRARVENHKNAIRAEMERQRANKAAAAATVAKPAEHAAPEPNGPGKGITIEHTGDGTLVHGTTREDAPVLKKNGFKWSRNLDAWYLPRTWGYNTRQNRVNSLRQDLPGASVEGTAERSTTAEERFAQRQERAGQRAERLTERAGKLQAKSEAHFAASDRATDGIPFGQPVLIGHHSQRRHERALEKARNQGFKGLEANREATRAQEAAKSATAGAQHRETVQATGNRIARNEAELRRLQRSEVSTTDPQHKHYLQSQIATVQDELQHDRNMLNNAEASGKKIYRQSDFKPGDYVKIRGQWREVHKSNAKSLTVGTGYSWTDRVPFHEATGRTAREDLVPKMTARLSGMDPADAASKANALGPGMRAALKADGFAPSGYSWKGDKLVKAQTNLSRTDLSLFDPAKHPRGAKGTSNGGRFVPIGQARNAQAAQAQKSAVGKETYTHEVVASGPVQKTRLQRLDDRQLAALTRTVYSFKSSDPRVVKLRLAVAAEMAKRGYDVKDFGALGGGINSDKKLPPVKAPAKKPVTKATPAKKTTAKAKKVSMSNSRAGRLFDLAKLTSKRRKQLKPSQFALPDQQAYPIDTAARARSALARVAANGSDAEKAAVARAVAKKFPNMDVAGQKKKKGNGKSGSKPWTAASDDAYDKAHGIAENSPRDKALDKARGVK